MGKVFCFAVMAALVLAGRASEVPVVDGRIVINDAGTYELSSDATVSSIVFRTSGAVISGDATLTLTEPATIIGGGSVLVPMDGTDGLVITNAVAVEDCIPQREGTMIWREDQGMAGNYSDVEAYIGGTWPLGSASIKSARKAFQVAYSKESSTNAVVQYHLILASGRTVGFKVNFWFNVQDGNTYCSVIWAKYLNGVDGEVSQYAYDNWDTVPTSGTYGTPYALTGIALCKIKRTVQDVNIGGVLPRGALSVFCNNLTILPDDAIAFTNRIDGMCESVRFKGKQKEQGGKATIEFPFVPQRNGFKGKLVLDSLDITTANYRLLPRSGTLVLTNGTSFTFTGRYEEGESTKFFYSAGSAGPCYCIVNSNCTLTFAGGSDWHTGGSTYLTVDGGSFVADAPQYASFLELLNGGTVKGSKTFSVGNEYAETYTRTRGSVACTSDIPFRVYNRNDKNVHTFDTEADLYLNGGFGTSMDNNGTARWVKTGPAKLYMSGSYTSSPARGPITIDDGTFVFDCHDALLRTNDVVLAGGALDEGSFTNRLGTLSVTTNSMLVAGSGALTFSDSSSVAWTAGARLSITGATDSLKTGHIRFLGSGLTADQLSAMRYNGKLRLAMDEGGWLRSYQLGSIVIVK